MITTEEKEELTRKFLADEILWSSTEYFRKGMG